MKTTTTLSLLTFAATLALCPVFAQSPSLLAPGETGGLLGQAYTGVEFGYTHHVESAPRVLRRYGFVSSKPLDELGAHVDASFRYDYTRGSEFGARFDEHDLMVGFLRYFPQAEVKPYLSAEFGWAWEKFAGNDEDSFVYRLGAGVEFLLKSRVALTPFVTYRDARAIEQRAWNVGARLGIRATRAWNWSFTLQVDDDHNIEYAVGAQRRF